MHRKAYSGMIDFLSLPFGSRGCSRPRRCAQTVRRNDARSDSRNRKGSAGSQEMDCPVRGEEAQSEKMTVIYLGRQRKDVRPSRSHQINPALGGQQEVRCRLPAMTSLPPPARFTVTFDFSDGTKAKTCGCKQAFQGRPPVLTAMTLDPPGRGRRHEDNEGTVGNWFWTISKQSSCIVINGFQRPPLGP